MKSPIAALIASMAAIALYSATAGAQLASPPTPEAENTLTESADATASSRAEPSAIPEKTTPATASVSEAKLNQFADAYVAIVAIQTEANTERSTGEEDLEAQKAKESALQTKMKDAIQKTGLQVEEFNQIAQQSATDLDLRARLAQKVQERNGERTGG